MRISARLDVVFFAAAATLSALGSADAAVTLTTQDKSDIRRCVGHMLLGPQRNGIKVKGQGFNCKPVTAKLVGGNLVVKGQLSHQLTYRPDDQVNYTFEFAMDGKLVKRDVKVEDGGIIKVLGFAFGPGTLEVLSVDKLATLINDGWTGYSALILGDLQERISQGLAQNTIHGASTYFMDRPYGDISSLRLEVDKTFASVQVRGKYPLSFVNACKAMCRAVANCRAWTFIRKDKRCYLKDSTHRALSFHEEGATGLR